MFWKNDDGLRYIAQIINFGFMNSRECRCLGFNGKMSEYHAAVGLAMLDTWDWRASSYANVAATYLQIAAEFGLQEQLLLAPQISSAYALQKCATPDRAKEICDQLSKHGIGWRFWYENGVHEMSHFSECRHDRLSDTSLLGKTVIGLPIAVDLNRPEMEYILAPIASSTPKQITPDRIIAKPAKAD